MIGAGPQERAECGCETPRTCAIWGCTPQTNHRKAAGPSIACIAGWVLAVVGWTGLYVSAYIAPVAHWHHWFD